jgi:hypothetical protein
MDSPYEPADRPWWTLGHLAPIDGPGVNRHPCTRTILEKFLKIAILALQGHFAFEILETQDLDWTRRETLSHKDANMTSSEARKLKAGDVLAGDDKAQTYFGQVMATTASHVAIRWDNTRTGEPMSHSNGFRFFEMSNLRIATQEDLNLRTIRYEAHAGPRTA